MLERFLKTWGEREKTRAQYSSEATQLSSDGSDTAGIALALSRRLITVEKTKNIVQIEAGMEMIALAIAISSEVCDVAIFEKKNELTFLLKNNGMFPEMPSDVKSILRRFEHTSWFMAD